MDNMKGHELSKEDVNAIFNTAQHTRNTGKFNKLLNKKQVSLDDLQNSWKEAGYPDDTRDITNILKQAGFGDNEIKKVFSKVFSQEITDKDDYANSPQATKLAAFIKQNGFTDQILNMLKTEFGKELKITPETMGDKLKKFIPKVRTEDVYNIFKNILLEERTDIIHSIALADTDRLGRSKKHYDIRESPLSDVISADQYITLLKKIKAKANDGIDVTHIKNQVIKSWNKGLKSRKHFIGLVNKINLNIHDLI